MQINERTITQINDRLRNGEKLEDIAKDLGLSYSTLYQRLRMAGGKCYVQWELPAGNQKVKNNTAA